MLEQGARNLEFGADKFGFRDLKGLNWNFLEPELYECALKDGEAQVTSGGALCAETGVHTPKAPIRIRDSLTFMGRAFFRFAFRNSAARGPWLRALWSGRIRRSLSPSTIPAVSMQPEGAAEGYERHIAEHLFADHRMSVALSKVLAKDWGARGAVRVVGINDWTRRNFARWMFEDEPRAVALTPARWHRRMFRRDGAFA